MKQYTKSTLNHSEFYIAAFTKDSNLPYVLFIHGGPGFNCGVLEYLINNRSLFASLNCNIILYDQRNCGRSPKTFLTVSHQNNIDDLQNIILYLSKYYRIKTQALIGHSYGAKLLFDYYKKYSSSIKGVFVSTANSILIPRLNNLMIDLSYLKKNNLIEYNKLFHALEDLNPNKLWELSEQLTHLFQKNEDRPYLYWANVEYYHLVHDIQKRIQLPIDTETFLSVRKELYLNESNFIVDINSLNISKLWVNGFHDFIMNGHEDALFKNKSIIIFYKSAHYPHIEENQHFSEILNEFIKHS